jgi:hypothetical protein
MRKAEEQGVLLPEPSRELMALLTTPEDKACSRPWTPSRTPGTGGTHLSASCQLLSDGTCGLLHRYYTVHHILSGDDQDLLRARILLFRAVAGVLKTVLISWAFTLPSACKRSPNP